MDRKTFLKIAGVTAFAGATMKLKALHQLLDGLGPTETMPALFVGHGSPMNAIEDNAFSREMRAVAAKLPHPKAILMVSAHWETKGTKVTAQELPPTIHDFGGFPQELFDVQYPAKGSPWLVGETQALVHKTPVAADSNWGLDHGCWSVTRNMWPNADIPIVQISLDYTQSPQYHYELAQELAALRNKGVLIIGSGNIVHNLGMVAWNRDFNVPFAYDWATEINETFKKHIVEGNHSALINYQALGKSAQLAIPTPEHYLPLLYVLGTQSKDDSLAFFNDIPVGGSLSMTSVVIGKVS
ncbi:MAG: 4,5-DOPA dioxygenase extradiol [Bacteroidetes bacterium]|nr:4,5-DOPA dioxygenase extradiol [Bacteroidota bacterium]